MSEPSRPANHLLSSLPENELATLIKHQFPAAVISGSGSQFALVTVHGTGDTEREALENALSCFNDMARDGRSLRQMLDDVITDLRESGMSRMRHDSLMDILSICENALNGGVITGTVPWIMVPSYNREITSLRLKVSNRLGIAGQDAAAREERARRGKQEPGDSRLPRTHTAGTLRLLEMLRVGANESMLCDVERVVHCKKHKYDTYIGRAANGMAESKWHNPFVIGKDGTRNEVLAKYEDYLMESPALLADLHELDQKVLGCWCAPLACHGDVLVAVRDDQFFKRNRFRV
jgi:Domain of unknown function (DUF4326)